MKYPGFEECVPMKHTGSRTQQKLNSITKLCLKKIFATKITGQATIFAGIVLLFFLNSKDTNHAVIKDDAIK